MPLHENGREGSVNLRAAVYAFTHRVLYALVKERGPAILDELIANPERLGDLWDAVGREFEPHDRGRPVGVVWFPRRRECSERSSAFFKSRRAFARNDVRVASSSSGWRRRPRSTS